VFVFHGAGKTGEEARARFGLEATTDAGAIFVYPNAIQGTWDIRPASADGRRVDVLIRRLSESYCIDPRRIDIAGFSAGAVFTLYLGCNVPDTFQGMAAVAGSVQRFNQSCCHSTLSALFIHGTEDEAFPITEGQRARDLTLKRDGCGTTPTPEGAHCQDYDCPAPLDVGYCEWDGDHDVPPWAGGEITRFFGL
jgi:polyhydroxybutyrate depolymerase